MFILTAFNLSEIFCMVVRCNTNGGFPYQRVPCHTKSKILALRLVRQNLSNTAINFFLQKKQLIDLTSCFTQMNNYSEQSLTNKTEVSLFAQEFAFEGQVQQMLYFVTFSKHVKLSLFNLFELPFFQNVSGKSYSYVEKRSFDKLFEDFKLKDTPS